MMHQRRLGQLFHPPGPHDIPHDLPVPVSSEVRLPIKMSVVRAIGCVVAAFLHGWRKDGRACAWSGPGFTDHELCDRFTAGEAMRTGDTGTSDKGIPNPMRKKGVATQSSAF